MKLVVMMMAMLYAIAICRARSDDRSTRIEAEYYVAADAEHYGVPVALVRAIVQLESNWRAYSVSPKGAVGRMLLPPVTAHRLGVSDPCNPAQNVSGGVRYLAWLMNRLPTISGWLLPPAAPAKTGSTKEAFPTETPLSSRMSQGSEPPTLAKQRLNLGDVRLPREEM